MGEKDIEGTRLLAYIVWRIILFGSILLALFLSVRFAMQSMQGNTTIETPGGQHVGNSPPSPGNQFRMNNVLMKLHMGTGDAELALYLEEFSHLCKARGGTRNSDLDSGTESCTTITDKKSGQSIQDYVLVSKNESGETQFVHLAPQEAQALTEMVAPAGQDAPGFDIPDVPRASGLDRWMSFEDPSGQYQTVMYGGSKDTPQQLLSWYEKTLLAQSWKVLRHEKSGEAPYLFATRNSALLVVRSSTNSEGTSVTLMATR